MKLFFGLPGHQPAFASHSREAGRRRQTKTISPFGQEGYHFLSYGPSFVLITASQSSVLFAHRRLPMGKKRKTLCVLCGSVVKYSIKDT
jgi:hypothetical protein